MKKVLFLVAIAATTLTSCDFINQLKGGKSEEDIRKEVEAEVKHQQDSIRLAEAEARALAAEEKADRAMEAADRAEEAAQRNARAVTTSTTSSYSGVYDGNPYTWLSERYVTSSDLSGLTKAELRILRNAIYARHGYKFKSADLRQFFSQFSWYYPQYSNVEGSLSKIERQNVATIQSWE